MPLPHPKPTRPAWFDEHEEAEFTEGILVVDLLDAKTGQFVWHGAARVEIDPKSIDDELLRRATVKLLGPLPTSYAPRPAP